MIARISPIMAGRFHVSRSPASYWKSLVFFAVCGMPMLVSAQTTVAQFEGSGLAPSEPGQEFAWKPAGKTEFGKAVTEPLPAWKIVTQLKSPLCYGYEPTWDQVKEAFEKGWRLTAKVRLDTAILPTPQRYSAAFGFEALEQGKEWLANILVDEAGGLLVQVNRNKFPLLGLSVSDYHTYELIYDATTQSVRLMVDNQLINANIAAVKSDKTRIVWGNTSVTAESAAEWASVKFEILP